MMRSKVFLLVLVFTFLFSAQGLASEGIEVILDDESLAFSVEPRVIQGNTMVPLRAIFEALGATVLWNGDTKTVTATKDDTVVILTIGNKVAFKNNQPIELSVSGTIIDGSTLVPLRFVAESFGAYVHWNGTDRVISITSDGTAVTYESRFVRINTASVEQLKRIMHIDDARADMVDEMRKAMKFTTYEDLMKIPGIGEQRMKDIREQGIIKF